MATGGAATLTAGAAIVFLGVIASLIFERYRVPDVVLLLLGGILLGPVLGVLDASAVGGLADIFTTLALVVILFEGGLDLKISHLKNRFALTSILLLVSYFATAFAVAGVVLLLTDFAPSLALLFGFVIAPLSSSILIPLVSRLRVMRETRSILIVESALGDTVAVLVVSTFAGVLAGGGLDVQNLGRTLASSFLLGTLMAVGAGILWLVLLRFLKGRPYTYLVTFAASVLLFGLVELAGGNGVVAVLVFALVLGNAEVLARRIPGIEGYRLDDRIRWFHAEMSFFVRTFFFIYLGLLVTPASMGTNVLLASLAVVGVILFVRGALVYALVKERPAERQDASYLTFLIARGLASAALATLPAVVLLSEGTLFQALTFAVVLLTNLAMTAFILVKENGPGTGAEVERAFGELLALDLEGLNQLDVGEEPERAN